MLRKTIFDPLMAFKAGSPLVRCWKELEKTQYLPEKILRKKQWERLKDTIEYAYQNNAFYKKRFEDAQIEPVDIKVPNDIMKIPILTKADIRNSYDSLISDGYNKDELLHSKTGGSTGKSLNIYFTEECSEIRNACARQRDRWSGWDVGEARGAVWGNPVLPTGWKSRLKAALSCPHIYLDTMSVSEESVKNFAKEWEKVSPTLLFGHAHSIFLLAQHVIKLDIKTIKPKGIISSSMMLLPHERVVIEKAFGVKVFDRYGCEEVSLIASECEKHEGMHLNIEHLFIEFLRDDGSYAKPGEEGKIVVTDLVNKAMPFIRYCIEDVGVPLEKKCSCGRGMPLMGKVSGRVADFLVKKDGAKVAGISIIENTLTEIPGIEQMQIIQNDIDNILLNIVIDKNFTEESEKRLKNYFQELFGSTMNISLKKVSKIKQEKNGKYRFSICNI